LAVKNNKKNIGFCFWAGLSRQITVSFNPRKLVIPAAAVLVVAAALVIVLGVLPGKKTALRASGKPTIAVVNFENKTGDKDLDIWSTGIRDLLIFDLAQSRFMNVLSDTDIYGILKKFDLADTSTFSTGDLVKIADAGGAQYTVNGSFLKAGDEIIINATCQKPHSRDVISPIQMTCLNLTQAHISGDIDKDLGEISTPNAEAWAYYLEEWDKAVNYLEKCVSGRARNVNFYSMMASAFRAKGEPAKAQEVLEKYLREVENTAAGHRNLAYHHLSQNRLDLAGRELEAAETLAPDDYENRHLRGDLLLFRGDLPRAEAEYRALLGEKVPMAVYAGYNGISSLIFLEGRYEEFIKMAVPLIERFRRSGVGVAEWNGRAGAKQYAESA
jgi:TolB-like protein